MKDEIKENKEKLLKEFKGLFNSIWDNVDGFTQLQLKDLINLVAKIIEHNSKAKDEEFNNILDEFKIEFEVKEVKSEYAKLEEVNLKLINEFINGDGKESFETFCFEKLKEDLEEKEE